MLYLKLEALRKVKKRNKNNLAFKVVKLLIC